MFHSQFEIDGIKYMLEAECPQAVWPRVCDRVQKELMRYGKDSAKEVFGRKATSTAYISIMGRTVRVQLTVNPEGINHAVS